MQTTFPQTFSPTTGTLPWENSWKRGTDAKPKGLRVSYQGTKGGNIRFNMGIDPGEKVSKHESTETGKKEIYFGLNPINNAREFCGCCSSPRLLKGPPTATDRQAALVTHSTALGWKEQGWRAGHHEQEGEGSTSCTPAPPKASPPL